MLLLPNAKLPLVAFEDRYLILVEHVLRSRHRLIGLVNPVAGTSNKELAPKLCQVGCAGRLQQFEELADHRYLIQLNGVCRFDIAHEVAGTQPFREVIPDWSRFLDIDLADGGDKEIARDELIATAYEYFGRVADSPDVRDIEQLPDASLVTVLAMICPFGERERQAIVCALTLADRAATIQALMQMSFSGSASKFAQ